MKVSFVNTDPSALIPQSGRPEPQIPFRLESSDQAIMGRLERGAEKCRARTGGNFSCKCPMKAFWLFYSSAWLRAGWPERSCAARALGSSAIFSSVSPARWSPVCCFQSSALPSAPASCGRSSIRRSAPSCCYWWCGFFEPAAGSEARGRVQKGGIHLHGRPPFDPSDTPVVLLDDLDDPAGPRFDQNRAAVHNRVA